jgi:hypothetical protein
VAQGHSETRPKNIKGVIPFDTGLLYETAVLFTDKKLVLPADTNAGGPLVLSNKGKLHGFRDYYQCACGAQEAVVHVSVDTVEDNPNKLPKKVGEAFSSVLSLLGGNEEDVSYGSGVARHESSLTARTVIDRDGVDEAPSSF